MENLISTIGVSTIFATTIATIAQIFLAAYIKNSIQSKFERELVSIKHDFERQATEHRLKFSYLQENRARALEQAYSALHESFVAVRRLSSSIDMHDIEKTKENIDFVNQKIRIFDDTFSSKKIYFSEKLALDLESFLSALKNETLHYGANYFSRAYSDDTDTSADRTTEVWHNIHLKVIGPIQNSLKQIEKEMRHLLGAEGTF